MSNSVKTLGTELIKPEIKTFLIKGIDGKLNRVKVDISEKEIDLEKSIAENNFSFTKTGLEIKERLINKKQEEEINKQIQLQNLISLIKQIGVEPIELCPSYCLRGIKINSTLLPKRYSYEQKNGSNGDGLKDCCESNSIAVRSEILTPGTAEKDINNRGLMQNYNDVYERYIDCLIEISYIDVMINNLVDEQTYSLASKQLIDFGF
jgi:hypothetical protein